MSRNTDDGSFSLLLGNAEGRLSPFGTLTLDTSARDQTLADMNDDGRSDAVIGSYGMNTVTMRPGLASGGFGSPIVIATPPRPQALACGDLNGDGRRDLVVATYTEGKFRAYLQQPEGTFVLTATMTATGVPSSIALADLDSNGALDVLVTGGTTSGSVRAFLGSGTGSFSAPQVYGVGQDPQRLLVGDFNGDGHPDWAVSTNDHSHPITIELGLGDGTFATEIEPFNDTGASVAGVGDWNRDGKDDLAVANGDIKIYTGGASPTFPLLGAIPGPEAGHALVAADFDGDGDTDAAMAGTGNGGIALAHGKGNGTFGATPLTVSIPETAASYQMGDVNGDGRWDLVILVEWPRKLLTYLTGPDGIPVLAADSPTLRATSEFALQDMNHDGRADVIALHYAPGALQIFLAQPDGSFAPLPERPTITGSPTSVAAAFLDGDSHADIVVGEQNTMTTLLGTGDGTFQSSFYTVAADYPLAMQLADVDANGHLDAVVDDDTGNFYLYRGNSTHWFEQGVVEIPASAPPKVLVAAKDVNQDGFADVVLGHDRNLYLYAGNALGDLEQPTVIDAGSEASPIETAFGDIDGDGKLDLVTSRWALQVLGILYGAGGGVFDREENYGIDLSAGIPVIRDQNDDGFVDLTMVASNQIVVLLQNASAVAVEPKQPGGRIALAATPNPAREPVGLELSLPEAGFARVGVFDLRGRLVSTLWSGSLPAGPHRLSWNGRWAGGDRAATGVYFVRAISDLGQASTKLVLMN